jgi:hypothetical protein
MTVDSIVLAMRSRRGVPADLESRLAVRHAPEAEILMVSILTSMTSLGSTALVHVDLSPAGRSVTGRGFISLVDWTTRRQCVDAELPLAPDTRPIIGFRGDTVVVVQNIVGGADSTTSITTIRMFRIPTCAAD